MPKKSKLRLFVILSSSLLVIIIIAGLVGNSYISKRVLDTLKERIDKGSHGEYALTVDEVNVNLFTRSISMENFIIAPVNIHIAEFKVGYIIKANSLKVTGFSLMSYFKNKDLHIRSIQFDKSQISVFQKQRVRKTVDADTSVNELSLFEIISPSLRSLEVDEIDIDHSRLNIYRNSADTIALLSSEDNSISIRKFLVNAETESKKKLFQAEKFEITMNRFSFHLPGDMYNISGKKLYASYLDSVIRIDSFQLVPKYPKKEFSKRAGRQTTRAGIVSSLVTFEKIDVKLFLEQSSLIAKSLSLEGVFIDAYRDNNIPLEEVERPSVQTIIREIPFALSIDTIKLVKAAAVYEDIPQGGSAGGIMTIDNINGMITGCNNDTTGYNDKSSVHASLSAVFMKTGYFNAVYSFPLNTRHENFYCSGKMSKMPITAINPLTLPTKGIKIESGTADSMKFSFSGNGKISSGEMVLAYHDLKVEVLSKDDEAKLKTRIKNVIANNIVLKDGNPGKDGNLRVVKLGVQKNVFRYFPYFFMQSLLSGITASVQGEAKSKFLKRTRLFEKK
jgi:hypothetical protein